MNKIDKLFIVIIWLIAIISTVMNMLYVTKIDELENENNKLKTEIYEREVI